MLKSQWKVLPSTCGCSFVSPYALTVSVNAGRGVIRMYRWYILDYIAKPQCTHEATNIYSIRRWIYQDIDFMTKKEKSQPPKDFFFRVELWFPSQNPGCTVFSSVCCCTGVRTLTTPPVFSHQLPSNPSITRFIAYDLSVIYVTCAAEILITSTSY